MTIILEAAPPLKYAKDVELFMPRRSTFEGSPEAFLSNFTGVESLRIYLNKDVVDQFPWGLLRLESAQDLRLIKVSIAPPPKTENKSRSVYELVRYCLTLPQRAGREGLEIDFTGICLSGAAGRRIIDLSTL
ncbi:hypothetical protein AAVH_30399 [Aphelenchoides avenae]|nr:hypothetical protein AAVH_30399 [Aphelenchus avenae]